MRLHGHLMRSHYNNPNQKIWLRLQNRKIQLIIKIPYERKNKGVRRLLISSHLTPYNIFPIQLLCRTSDMPCTGTMHIIYPRFHCDHFFLYSSAVIPSFSINRCLNKSLLPIPDSTTTSFTGFTVNLSISLAHVKRRFRM